MKASYTFLIAALAAASLQAGAPSTPSAPAPYGFTRGTGAYFALQAGANFAQDLGDGESEEVFGSTLSLDPKDSTGFVGGLKLGYIFGKSIIRPTLEADVFYNQFDYDVDARWQGVDVGGGSAEIQSGAALANLLFRVDLGVFQPYAGAGAGAYYVQADDIEFEILGSTFKSGETPDNSGFAWQLVAGADIFIGERTSLFAEYKFLNYEEEDGGSQHIGVLGLRVGF